MAATSAATTPTGSRNGERLTGRAGLTQPRQDGLGGFLHAQFNDLKLSPRAEMLDIFQQGVMEPYINRAQLDDADFRKQLIRDAMNCVLDIKSGRGSMWFSSGHRRAEVNAAMHFVWDGIQDVLAHVGGGDLNFITQCLNDYVEVTLEFITPQPRWVEQGHERDLPIKLSIPGQAIGKSTISGPLTEEDAEILSGKGDLSALSDAPPALATGNIIPMKLEDAEPQRQTCVVGEGDAARTYVMTDPVLPRDMQGADGEFMITTLSQLLTRGPLVETLLYHVSREKQVKGSSQLQPVWNTVITSLRRADQAVVGNWLANVRSEEETPRAGRMIIQWATSLINATRMAEEVTSVDTKPMDGVIDNLIAQTEFFPGLIVEKGNDDMGAQVLREYIMQLFNNVSRAGVLEALSSVVGDPQVETGKGEWLKELTKVLRDSGYDPRQNEPAKMKVAAGTPLGHVKMSQMQTGAVPISGDEKLRITVASALCGTVATYPKGGQGELVKMALPQLLVLEPRKAKAPGRPILMMTEATTTEVQQARMSEFLLNQADILLSLVGHANEADPATITRGETLNLQQRIATMITMWSHILSERPNEPMDHVKDAARGRFLGTMLSWYFSGHNSALVSSSIEQAIRIVGLRWPEPSIRGAIQDVVNRGPVTGTATRQKAKKFAALIGTIHPDLTLNLGRAQATIPVAEVEAEGGTGKKSKALKKELGITSADVYTAARQYLVEAEKVLIENIERATQDLGAPERRKIRESILGAFSDINFIYEMNVLAQDNTPQSMIALAHALRSYNATNGIQNVGETRPTFEAIQHIIDAAENANIHYEMPTIRMGNRVIRNPARLPVVGRENGVKLDANDVQRIIEYARNIFTFSDSLLGDSLDILDGYTTAEERAEIATTIGAQLKKQLASVMKHKSPPSYTKLLDAMETRVTGIETRVRDIGKKMIGASSLLTMDTDFEASFKERIAKMKDGVPEQLVTEAKTKERALRAELDQELKVIFTESKGVVLGLQKNRMELTEEILRAVLNPLGIHVDGTQITTLLGLLKGADSDQPVTLAQVLNHALMMVGAGGLGYALGKGASSTGRSVEAANELIGNLTYQSAGLSSAQVGIYQDAARIKRNTVMESMNRIYEARLRYYDEMMEAATAVQADDISAGLLLQRRLIEKQYGEVRQAIDGVFAFTHQLMDIRIKGLGLRIEEAQETYTYIVTFMKTMRPMVKNMIFMAEDQWGLNIESGMSGWESPEAVLGVTAPAQEIAPQEAMATD